MSAFILFTSGKSVMGQLSLFPVEPGDWFIDTTWPGTETASCFWPKPYQNFAAVVLTRGWKVWRPYLRPLRPLNGNADFEGPESGQEGRDCADKALLLLRAQRGLL